MGSSWRGRQSNTHSQREARSIDSICLFSFADSSSLVGCNPKQRINYCLQGTERGDNGRDASACWAVGSTVLRVSCQYLIDPPFGRKLLAFSDTLMVAKVELTFIHRTQQLEECC